MSGEIETKQDDIDEGQITARWLREISLASTHEETWRKRADKVIERYRDEEKAEEGETRSSKFNILYSNTEVLRGVLYQRMPTPDVRRRFLDKDKVGREAATILQRALSFCNDSYDFDGVLASTVEDYLLPGRGLAKIKYVPTYAPMMDEMGQPAVDEEGNPVQEVVYEAVEADYVEWDMVRISPAKRWEKVRWVAFGELLTRDELVKQFGETGKQCALDWSAKDKEQEDELFKRALVWTIWDKTTKKVHVVSKGMKEKRLSVVDDPLGLKEFFPCPRPIYAIHTTGSMIPIPEYTQYQDQAIELDNLTARINVLTDGLRRRGVYDSSYPELAKLANSPDNTFVAVENFANLVEKGGLSAALYESPIDGIAAVLMQLMTQREQVKAIIYEETGIADVVRGVSSAQETLGAQQLKANYANSRTAPRQKAIQNFARDLIRIKAEIIAEKFSPKTLAEMTGVDLAMNAQEKQQIQQQIMMAQQAGQQMPAPAKLNKPTWEEIMQILRSDKLRGFRVDIETDSTVQPDATEEQKNRIELLSAVTGFLQGVGPAVQMGAIPIGVAKEMLSFGMRAFKVSPQMEEALDQMGNEEGQDDKGQAQAAQMKSKEMEQQIQQMNQELQDKRAEEQKMQIDAQVAQMNAQNAAKKLEIEQFNAETARGKAMSDAQPEDLSIENAKLQLEQQRIDLEARTAKLEADTAILLKQMDMQQQHEQGEKAGAREAEAKAAEAEAKAQKAQYEAQILMGQLQQPPMM